MSPVDPTTPVGPLDIKLDRPLDYDRVIGSKDGVLTLKDLGNDLTVITKSNATVTGRALAVITFTVQLPDGRLARAQTVTSVRNLAALGRALIARYGNDGGK